MDNDVDDDFFDDIFLMKLSGPGQLHAEQIGDTGLWP
jgi:hypothetical protein